MTNKSLRVLALTLLMVGASHAQASLVRIIDVNGQLLGANNVLVDGSLFNVSFLDGTCIALFDGCDDTNDFAFTTLVEVNAASEALRSLVFSIAAPSTIRGCESDSLCGVITPFELLSSESVRVITVGLNSVGGPTIGIPGSVLVSSNTFDSNSFTYAVWQEAVPVLVSEPSTVAIIALGLMGLSARRFKKQS